VDLDAFAAKMEQLVILARHEQAAGNIEGAREHVRRIEGLAAVWEDSLTSTRLPEKEDLSSRQVRPAAKMPDPGRPEPTPTEDRLSRLERTVERLVSALEKNTQADLNRREVRLPSAKPTGQPQLRVEGVVQRVDPEKKRVEISIGSDDGLVAGHELFVYRRDRPARGSWEVELVGRIRIVATNPDQAFAKVTESKDDKEIKEGDRVSTLYPSPDEVAPRPVPRGKQ
jgi:hypothetical protein